MIERYLPASPNWYCAQIIDFNANGILAYGSRNSIILLKLLNDNSIESTKLGYYGKINVHSNRITSVKFCNVSGNNELLASTGDDHFVAVSEIGSQKVIFKHDGHSAKISCVSWSSSNDLAICVVTGDDSGLVIVANIDSKKRKEYIPYKAAVTCISCCSFAPHLTAIGYASGKIVIIDLNNRGDIIFDVKQHDREVLMLCWAPFIGAGLFENDLKDLEGSQETNDIDYLLASSSRDKNIKIWSILRRLCVKTFVVPTNVSDGYQKKFNEQSKSSIWITLNWPASQKDTLLSSCLSGNLLTWDLNRNKRPWEILDKEKHIHSRTIYNIATFKNVAVTISMDRYIAFWSINETEGVWKYTVPTLGGVVSKLTFSPVNSSILAIGCGDSTIRVWNILSHDNPFNASLFWQGLNAEVTSLAWHPKKESHLAFGTKTGYVGVYNVLTNKPPTIFKAVHAKGSKIVYTVCWGPAIPTKGNVDTMEVYSCGGMTVFLHHSLPDKGSVNINNLLRNINLDTKTSMKWTDVSWKPDFSLLCLGSDKGYVELYDPADLRLLIVLPGISGKNYVHCLQWHPKYTFGTQTSSRYQHLLAVASQNPNVYVYDLSEHLNDSAKDNQLGTPIQITSCDYQLAEHKASIASLAWSPHFEGQMVTVSFDGTACVWDVIDRKILACFNGHEARVLSVEWNPSDPNIIFSGGEDFMVYAWRISEQDNKFFAKDFEKDFFIKKNVKVKPVTTENKELTTSADFKIVSENSCDTMEKSNVTINNSLDDVQNMIKGLVNEKKSQIKEETEEMVQTEMFTCCSDEKKTDNTDALSPMENFNSNTVNDEKTNGKEVHEILNKTSPEKNIAKQNKKKKKIEKALFPLTNRKESAGKFCIISDCMALTDRLTKSSNQNSSDEKFGMGDQVNLGIYGDRMDAYRLLKTEADNHIESGNIELALQLEIWKGNIMEALKMAAKHEQLSDTLVSLATSVSPQFWSEMCLLYAKQLVSFKQPHKAVLFLLANNKVYEAIDLLKTNVSYREAIILAKFRLMAKDPLIPKLVEEWAEDWLKVENNDCAAKCYLSIGQFEKAANILSRKHDPSSVKVAAYVADKSGKHSDSEVYALQCITDCLVNRNFSLASQVVVNYPQMKPFQTVIEVHKIVSGEYWKHLLPEPKIKNPQLLSLARKSILAILDSMENDDSTLNIFFTTLSRSHLLSGSSNEDEMEAWISLNLVLISLQLLQKDFKGAVTMICNTFVECINRVKSFYLLPLAKSFFSLDNVSTLQSVENLNSLLEVENFTEIIDCPDQWWEAVVGFLCLAKLQEMLSCKNSTDCDDDLSFLEEAKMLSKILMNEKRAEHSMLKARLKYLTISMTVLTAIKKVNSDSKCQTEASVEVTDMIFYDKLLENSALNVENLNAEKEDTEKEIALLEKLHLIDKFPDPFESCIQILELALLKGEAWKHLFEEALTFGYKYVVTYRQFSTLSTLKERYAKKLLS